MLMMDPLPETFNAGKAALHMLNVPIKSISTTVRNPLTVKSSARDKKFPAAQFTSVSKCLCMQCGVSWEIE